MSLRSAYKGWVTVLPAGHAFLKAIEGARLDTPVSQAVAIAGVGRQKRIFAVPTDTDLEAQLIKHDGQKVSFTFDDAAKKTAGKIHVAQHIRVLGL